jgi:L-alanine-DL-glutamate epimerase-like enolase superfamily enzyme
VELTVRQHTGTIGFGEATPIYYRGETAESALAFLCDEAPALAGDDPFALEAIQRRLRARPGEQAAKAALDAALHDWIGKRLGQPVWRLLGLEPAAQPTSYTIAIDTLEGTRRRARRARGYRALKVKVGGADDLDRLRIVREESAAPLRVDANEGWTPDHAHALLPRLAELGVELLEQPFPADDRIAFDALHAVTHRPPVIVDEGCHDLHDVSRAAGYADGIVIKIAKAGGIREAIRMIHAARALGLRVLLGCMIESELGIAPAVHIASLVDWVDLDGHLLLADRPCHGLRFRDGKVLPSHAPGLGVRVA